MSQEETAVIYEMLKDIDYPDDADPNAMRVSMDAAAETFPPPDNITITTTDIAGIPSEWLVADNGSQGPVLLYLHGGGYIAGSPTSHRHLAGYLADKIQGRVLVPDYRLAPEHPFPAAVEDGLAVYEALLGDGIDPARLFVGGDSAGGGLTIATLLSVRDKGLPMPAAAILFSPWTDLTASGATIFTKAKDDPMVGVKAVHASAAHYLAGGDARNPLASPIFADLTGLPPVLIQTGSNEILLSDSETLDEGLRRDGGTSRLEVWDQMFHVWHAYWPILSEARGALDGAAGFILEHADGGTSA